MSQGQNVFWQSLFVLFGIGNGAEPMLRSEMCCVICAMPD